MVLLSVAVKDLVKHKPRTYAAKFALKESCSGHLDSEQLPGLDGSFVLPSALQYLHHFALPTFQRRYIVEYRCFNFAIVCVLESSAS